MNCDNCKSDRIFEINSKSSDLNFYSFRGGPSRQGYAPHIENICGGDYIEVAVCLNCGKVQGKFPVSAEELESLADNGPYYFYAGESKDYGVRGYGGKPMVLVMITSKKHWDENGCVSDWHLTDELDKLLPNGFAETMESCFESRYSLQQTRDRLSDAGFIEDDEFGNFCKRHDPFV